MKTVFQNRLPYRYHTEAIVGLLRERKRPRKTLRDLLVLAGAHNRDRTGDLRLTNSLLRDVIGNQGVLRSVI